MSRATHRASTAHRRIVLPLAVVLSLSASAVATAAWTSMGTGEARVVAGSVDKGNAPSVEQSPSSRAVQITWDPSKLTDSSVEAQSYDVLRDGAPVDGCTRVAAPTCTDAAPIEGASVAYAIRPRFGQNWTGAVSDATLFVFDAIAPATDLRASTPADLTGWTNADAVSLTLGARDAGAGLDSLTYDIDGVRETVGQLDGIADVTQDVPLSTEGRRVVSWYATDRRGNTNAASASTATVKIDRHGPEVVAQRISTSVDSSVIRLVAADPVPAGVNAVSGVDTVTYQVGAEPPVSTQASTVEVTVPAGETVTATAVDKAANVGKTIAETAPKDEAAPVTTVTRSGAAGAAPWYRGAQVAVALSVLDPGTISSGMKSAAYSVNGGAWTSYVDGASLTFEEDGGVWTVAYRAEDNAGNVETGSVTVKLDRTAPVTTATPGKGSGYNLSANDLAGPASNSGVSATYCSTTSASAGFDLCSTFTLGNNKTAWFYSVDAAGNQEVTRSVTRGSN